MAHCLKPGADCTIQGLPHRSSCAVRSVICSNKSQHSRQRLRYRRACSDDLSGGLAPHAEALEISAHAPSTAISRRQLIGRAAVLAACSCGACIGQAHPAAAAAEPYTPPFTYVGVEAASQWGGTCATGTEQSPIDLPAAEGRGPALGLRPGTAASRSSKSNGLSCDTSPLSFSYISSGARILNTGYGTMQVNMEPGNIVTVGPMQLQLLQFHFHAPSEHARGGVRAAMEAHLVHRNLQSGDLAVIAVLIEDGGSFPNPCLAPALAHAPKGARQEVPCPQPINPAQLLPGLRRYIHYAGSLTTPPCNEQVDWFVLQQPLKVPSQQVLDFMRFVGQGNTLATNARPLQPLNGRMLQYDCLAEPLPTPEPEAEW